MNKDLGFLCQDSRSTAVHMRSTSKRNRPPAIPPPSTASTEPDFAFTITRTAIAQICSSIGFAAAEAPALEILSDIATRYLRTIAKSAADSANSACRTQSNLIDTIAAVDELSSVKGFPGAWRASGCFLNSGAVKELIKFPKKSKEIPFAKPLPCQFFSVGGSRKGLRNVGSSNNNEYIGGEKKKHIPKWLPVMPVIENHEEEIIEKRRRELWGYCGKTEREKNDSGGEKEERKVIELPLKREGGGGGKVRFKIGGELGGVCRRRGRVLCENWNFADQNKSRLMR